MWTAFFVIFFLSGFLFTASLTGFFGLYVVNMAEDAAIKKLHMRWGLTNEDKT